jgi:hypothetical protein
VGAPVTKDACYSKGIVRNYAFIRAAFQHRRAHLIPYLFVGKVAHEDIPVLYARVHEGVVKPPVHVPPLFRDLNGLSIWIAYSDFLTRLGGDAVTEYYAAMFKRGSGLGRRPPSSVLGEEVACGVPCRRSASLAHFHGHDPPPRRRPWSRRLRRATISLPRDEGGAHGREEGDR